MEAKKVVTRCILFAYKFILLNPLSTDGAKRKIGTLYAVFGSVYLTLASSAIVILIMQNKNDFVEFILPIGYASTIFMNGINHLIIAYNVPSINLLLRNIERNIYTYSDRHFTFDNSTSSGADNETHSSNNVACTKLSVFLTILIYNNAFLGMISPFFGYLLTGKLSANIYPSWFPWNMDDSVLGYTVSYLLESYVALHVCSLYASTAVYMALTYLEYERQYRRLSNAVTSIPSRSLAFVRRRSSSSDCRCFPSNRLANERTETDDAKLYHKRFEYNLIECIDHHRALKRCFEYFKLYFEMNFSVEFTLCVLTLCFLMYSLLEVTDAGRVFSILAVTTILLQNLFLKCYVGEKFSELNGTLKEAIYDLPWYRQSISNRKLLHIFQLGSTQPHRLTGLKVFPASLFIFTRIIRTSYSLLNLIRASHS